MKVQFITYADTGSRHNLKSEDISSAIEFFKKQGVLGRVITRLGKRSDIDQRAAVSIAAHTFLGVLRRFLGFSTRKVEENIFDRNAARQLKKQSITFFHPPLFERTMKKSKTMSMCTVGIVTNSDPRYVAKLLQEEKIKQGESTARDSIEENYFIDTIDYLVALSPFSKSTYVKEGYPSEKIYIARLDVDTNRFVPIERTQEFTVVFPTSSIGILKGLQYLLDAWKNISIPNKKLIIMGNRVGWPKVMEEKYSVQIKNDPTIEEVGTVSNPEWYFGRAHAVVLPTFTEGFSRSIAEALSCEAAVITTERATDVVDFFKDNVHGILVPVGNAPAIEDALQLLYAQPNVRDAMGKAGRELMLHKKPFSEELFSIYQDICLRENIK